MEQSWKMGGKNKVVEIKNILEKSCFTAYHKSRMRSSDNAIFIGLLCTVIRLWDAFGLRSRFEIVMLGRRALSFRLLVLSLKRYLTFFSCM